MCFAPAAKKPFAVYMHTVVLSDLVPDTEYVWRVLDGSRLFRFRSPIRRGLAHARDFSFFAFGDMGQSLTKARKTRM
jgi:hypothetical protein